MTATAQDILAWISHGKNEGATHLIVGCDPMDFENFPVYIHTGEDVRVREQEIRKSGNRVDEVYWLDGDVAAQFSKHRSFTYGPEDG